MFEQYRDYYYKKLDEIRSNNLWKEERIITTPQRGVISTTESSEVVNLCANNYLGLSNHPEVIKAGIETCERWGFGLSSVRFICGTQELHKRLEEKLSNFLSMEDTVLYSSCFDANGGLFEVILGEKDAIISDELNHASIIDGIRLCKAKKYRYKNNDFIDLEQKLIEAKAECAEKILIATDGVFSMDGYIANLGAVCDLADKYGAMVMVDDSHAVGFIGKKGRGTLEYRNVIGRVDILTGTLGKALGGASGGYTSGRKEIISLLRQRSRPYLFSNSLAPFIVGASMKVLSMLEESTELRDRLEENAFYFRKAMTKEGFNIPEGEHPIIPIMLGDAKLANSMSESLLKKGIYAMGFCYPVVPREKARIRTQISAVHSKEDLDRAVNAFCQARKEML